MTVKIHRLVAETFIGPSPLNVNHKDGNKENNKLENLEYFTIQENMKHAAQNNLTTKGVKNQDCKLSEDDVREIRRIRNNYTLHELGKKYNVDHSTIWDVCNRTWKHVI